MWKRLSGTLGEYGSDCARSDQLHSGRTELLDLASQEGGQGLLLLTPTIPSKPTPSPCGMPDAEEAVEEEKEGDILQRLLMHYDSWERAESWGPEERHSAVFLIATVLAEQVQQMVNRRRPWSVCNRPREVSQRMGLVGKMRPDGAGRKMKRHYEHFQGGPYRVSNAWLRDQLTQHTPDPEVQ